MSMNREGRPTRPGSAAAAPATFTGNRALQIEEPLLFETGSPEVSGVDLPEPEKTESRLGGLERRDATGLAGLTEPQAMRHYVRLSQKNYAIDAGLYPLGSCTMKHNPRLNEKTARLPGFGDVHPLQPESTVQGALALMEMLAGWLAELTGMPGVALSPKAGAHGELCGMAAIKAAQDAKGEGRTLVVVPESAHGTNPATAALLGYKVRAVPARDDGTVSAKAVREALSDEVAGIMLTNPNTCGLFERDIVEIAEAVHEAGAYFYCDGANFNAIVGKARPGDLGIDAMHLNLHNTFSTPHGGGGPGSGPVVFSEALAPFAPVPFVFRDGDGLRLVEDESAAADAKPFGRLTAFHGQMGMVVRAMTYMLSHGSDGLKQASEDAVLNANYIRARLRDVMTQPFGDRICMHEVLFDDAFLKGTEVTTLDFAKAMIDEGFHPMTVYFPLVAHGAMLVEPTESETRESLDQFIDTLRDLARSAKEGDTERFTGAPRFAPRGRLDETRAARQPRLRWMPEAPAEAAE
jgi:glycine dehydrogenase subunit 2